MFLFNLRLLPIHAVNVSLFRNPMVFTIFHFIAHQIRVVTLVVLHGELQNADKNSKCRVIVMLSVHLTSYNFTSMISHQQCFSILCELTQFYQVWTHLFVTTNTKLELLVVDKNCMAIVLSFLLSLGEEDIPRLEDSLTQIHSL